jgi:uncharacterized protein
VQSFYAALGRHDVDAVLALFADSIEWREAEGFPYFGGTWTCPQQAVEGLLLPLGRDWDEFSASADSFVSEGDEVVAFGAYGGVNRATRRPLFAPFAHRWRAARSPPSPNTPTPSWSRPPRTRESRSRRAERDLAPDPARSTP